MLILPPHLEVAEDEDEDEDVVDAERVLDDVAGEEIERRLWRPSIPDEQIESEGERDPDGAPDGRFLDPNDVRLAIETDQVDRQDSKNAYMKGDPKPKRHNAQRPTLAFRRNGEQGLSAATQRILPAPPLACSLKTPPPLAVYSSGAAYPPPVASALRMDPELQKLIESAKLTTRQGNNSRNSSPAPIACTKAGASGRWRSGTSS